MNNTLNRLKYRFTDVRFLKRVCISQIHTTIQTATSARIRKFDRTGPSPKVLTIQSATSPKRKNSKINSEVTRLDFIQSRSKRYSTPKMIDPKRSAAKSERMISEKSR